MVESTLLPSSKFIDAFQSQISSVTFNTKQYVTTISNSFQPLFIFCHKEHHLRCCIGLELNIGLFQKNPNRGLGSWNFQEYWRTCGNYRSQLKKKRNFQGFLKNHVEFLWSWFLTLEFPKVVTRFCRITRSESLFSLEFPRVKLQI